MGCKGCSGRVPFRRKARGLRGGEGRCAVQVGRVVEIGEAVCAGGVWHEPMALRTGMR